MNIPDLGSFNGGTYKPNEAGILVPPDPQQELIDALALRARDYGAWESKYGRGSTSYAAASPPLKAKEPEIPEPATEERVDPFIGYKGLSLELHDGKFALKGAGYRSYSMDATAFCGKGKPHVAPDWDCTCGFWAVADRADADPSHLLATVELFGKVIEGETGWRAQRQRVLSLEARRDECSMCYRPSDGFMVDMDGDVVMACRNCQPFGVGTPADLTGHLGTEVRWERECPSI